MEMGGAVAAGAAAGAALGGGVASVPMAAGGAIAAVAVVTSSKLVNAIVNSRLGIHGPADNWAYCSTGDLHCQGNLCFGTYEEADTWYVKTYWSEYRTSHEDWVMCAGQE